MSHSVVRGVVFIPLPLPGWVALTLYMELEIDIYCLNTRRVTPNTPHLSLEENKRLYLCCFASFIICFTKLLQL